MASTTSIIFRDNQILISLFATCLLFDEDMYNTYPRIKYNTYLLIDVANLLSASFCITGGWRDDSSRSRALLTFI